MSTKVSHVKLARDYKPRLTTQKHNYEMQNNKLTKMLVTLL